MASNPGAPAPTGGQRTSPTRPWPESPSNPRRPGSERPGTGTSTSTPPAYVPPAGLSAAADILKNMFAQLGIADIGIELAGLIQDPNLTQADLDTKLYELPSYKKYFPGMDALRRMGGGPSNVQTEGQYLQQEATYRQVLQNNNLPAGFYDTKQDFADFMVKGVSPVEVQHRIDSAKRVIDSSDPSMRNAALDYYGLDSAHMMAYTLDPVRGQQVIDKQMRIIETGAAANRYGFNENLAGATGLVDDPYASQLSQSQTEAGFANAADMFRTDSKLAAIDGGQSFSQQDAIDSVLKNNLITQRRSQTLGQNEAARFSGSSGGRGTLGRNQGV